MRIRPAGSRQVVAVHNIDADGRVRNVLRAQAKNEFVARTLRG